MDSKQISIYEVMREPEISIPEPDRTVKVYQIPDDIWETRCKYCVHKRGEKNLPFDIVMIERPAYETVIPCRILRLFREISPGECVNFTPKRGTKGICMSCKYDNIFHEGFCTKEGHAPKRKVFGYGATYHCPQPDYYSEHIISVCDDYLEG